MKIINEQCEKIREMVYNTLIENKIDYSWVSDSIAGCTYCGTWMSQDEKKNCITIVPDINNLIYIDIKHYALC